MQTPQPGAFSMNSPHFTIRRERDSGFLLVSTSGLWTVPTVDAYFEALGQQASPDRAAGQGLRVLIDKRGTPVHTQETMCRIQAIFPVFYRSGDRVAAIVDTNLAKIQFRRTYSEEICQPFLSEAEARTWLSA